ncbi:hypothetical protein EMCRGX_G019378 [Ephydatia muelleri]
MPPEEFEKAARSRTKKPVNPHGKPGGIQRTPLHACDKAANQDLYNIIAERQERKSWSGHPHLNAEPAQGQVMTLIFKQPIQLDKDTQSDVEPSL